MNRDDFWLLPEGVEGLLPPDAERIEGLRRRLLDLYHGYGYELVIPPLVEHIESLLIGAGRDLDPDTFKLTDPLTGRILGVRADMTPQVARIDAHQLRRETPVRLCYIGHVLRARSDGTGAAGARCPLQIGVELYGHGGIESDLEVLDLMLHTLDAAGIAGVHVDLGHVGIYRSLASGAELTASDEAELFDLLQRKALADIEPFLGGLGIDRAYGAMLGALATLNGGAEVIAGARRALAGAPYAVGVALDALEAVAARITRRWPAVAFGFDLAELRGYHYHTGILFAAYAPGRGIEAARGGRYDAVGEAFGRARPATGWSADLRRLAVLGCADAPAVAGRVFAPALDDPALDHEIAALRAAGTRVVRALPGQTGDARAMGCDAELVNEKGRWVRRKS